MIPEPTVTVPPSPRSELWRKITAVAWLSVLLGLGMELLLLLATVLTAASTTRSAVVADLVQKISWSFLVCVGVSLGTAAARARPAAMGVLGLISAPAAFVAAKSLHKGVGQALGLGLAAGGASTVLVASLKAAEYGVLGTLLGWMSRRGRGLGAYAGTGGAIGLAFGTLITVVLVESAPAAATVASVLPKAINEVLFPLGCSLVLYAAEAFAKTPTD